MNRNHRLVRLLVILILAGFGLLGLTLPGCSDSTIEPAVDPGDLGGALAEGNLDPGKGSFLLQTLDIAPEGMPHIPIQLIGDNLVIDTDSNRVSLDVAIRNKHSEPLFSPCLVSLLRFDPAGVFPLNYDGMIAPVDPSGSPTGEVEYYYFYSEQMGEEGMLEPEETSAARTWVFQDPDLLPFSFAARAEFSLEPALSRIAGICFWDNNLNGVRDAEDPPLPAGLVTMTSPGGETTRVYGDGRGSYFFPVRETGLYTLIFDPLIETLAPIIFTTPNPRQVLLPPGPDGSPLSFRGAHFGLGNAPLPRPESIQFSDLPVDSLRFMHWAFIDAEILPDLILKMHVGHSGCGPVQPTSLFMSGGFMESEPVQADIVFVNESQELCTGWFENEYLFDLEPLYRRYLDYYGPGTLVLNVVDYLGLVHKLVFPIYPED